MEGSKWGEESRCWWVWWAVNNEKDGVYIFVLKGVVMIPILFLVHLRIGALRLQPHYPLVQRRGKIHCNNIPHAFTYVAVAACLYRQEA